MNYTSITLQDDIIINDIVSIHYFEYMSDFTFSGESHDFWEFLCVDRGVLSVQADNKTHILKKGDIIFHKPNEFHSLAANGEIAPTLVVCSFVCDSPSMKFFSDMILEIDDTEKQLLAQIIREARSTFTSRLDDPYLEQLVLSKKIPFGSQQLIKLYLQQLLINCFRRCHTKTISRKTSPRLTQQNNDNEIYNKILDYLAEHVNKRLSIEKICRDNLIGRSQLQKIFRIQNDCGIIDYFSRMKIQAAKQMIRDNQMNFTQISDALGYTSIHYFSRQFKKVSGMTPSEYASSILIMTEKS